MTSTSDTTNPLFDHSKSSVPWQTFPDMLEDIFTRYADREAVVDGASRYNYGELGQRVQQVASALVSRGFRQGDFLVIWAPNSWQWIVSAMACWWLGGVMVPVSAKLKGLDVLPILNNTGARFLFFSSDAGGVNLLEQLREYVSQDGRELQSTLPAPATFVNIDGMTAAAETNLFSWDEFLGLDKGRYIAPAEVSPEDVCYMIYTSGTTGQPKGVMRCHEQTLRGNWVQTNERGLTADDRNLVIPQFSHISGLGGLMRCLCVGMAHIVVRKYQPAEALQLIERERVTTMNGAPSLFSQLLADDHSGTILSGLRVVNTGASHIPPELIHNLLDKGVSFVCSAYAMTECSILCSTNPGDDVDVIAHTVGKPAVDIEVKVVDENGQTVTTGEQGEVMARGYSVMRGYFKDEERTREVLQQDGWLHTGDIGRMTPEGNLQIVGRIKDMIIVHGYNVFPVEVETQLMASGLLKEAAVVGRASRFSGEECVAFIVPKENPESARKAVLAWARKNMAEFKIPSRMIVRSSLPLNINGKLDRESLRRELGKQ